ncbi:glycosyltransferase family 2 protein [Thermicanus aegyptius]|uniref:glycosyltransferase family 2 protein n=1 Tax=Thermicanus aegyptius TaxID=94009 RepID=UPI000420D826|nr:glycosyltransferase family 2 protein [Thermicanus aegyptius]
MIKVSVCIPAYNRHQFLKPLLDSILFQDYPGLEIVICEDASPERELIRNVVMDKIKELRYNSDKIKYYENEKNIGYDGNIRNLLDKASGDYCLFMGNDDILMPGAIERILKVVEQHPDVAVISRAYQIFLFEPDNIQDTIKHLPEDKLFSPGLNAIKFFYRRVGVLSGLVFKRDLANKIATDRFDGYLYYQMYLAGMLLKSHSGYYISDVQTLSRDGIEPDFGNSEVEKKIFKPGKYTYESRVHMIQGLLKIADYIDNTEKKIIYKAIKKDISIYFYPYIRDQLSLPITSYIKMIRAFRSVGMSKEPIFYFHCIIGYILKKTGYDYIVKLVRKILGHSPKIGF